MNTQDITVSITIQVVCDLTVDGLLKNYHFWWDGPEDGILGISDELMKDANPRLLKKPSDNPQIGDEIAFGPYELIIVERQFPPVGFYFCVRKEFAEPESTLEERITELGAKDLIGIAGH